MNLVIGSSELSAVESAFQSPIPNGSKFYVNVYKTLYYEDPLIDFIHIWPDGRYRSKVFISTDPTPGDSFAVKVIEFS